MRETLRDTLIELERAQLKLMDLRQDPSNGVLVLEIMSDLGGTKKKLFNELYGGKK